MTQGCSERSGSLAEGRQGLISPSSLQREGDGPWHHTPSGGPCRRRRGRSKVQRQGEVGERWRDGLSSKTQQAAPPGSCFCSLTGG